MISFRKVTKNNIWTIASLSDGNNSEKFVDYTHNILIHALFYRKNLNDIKAIYNNKILIGINYYYEINKSVWINSFMIDHKFQNKGLGKKSFSKILNFIKKNNSSDKIELATSNPIAIKLYEKFGFKFLNNKRSNLYFIKNKEKLMNLKIKCN